MYHIKRVNEIIETQLEQPEGIDKERIKKIFTNVLLVDVDFLLSLNMSIEQYQQLSEVMSDVGDDYYQKGLNDGVNPY